MRRLCSWANGDTLEARYHDKEWGVPMHDDRKLFEFLILEGAQAGLSWSTILKKQEHYCKAYDNFDARKIARYNGAKILQLMKYVGIVRNRLKLRAFIDNARAFILIQKEYGSFDRYFWKSSGGKPIHNRRRCMKEIPTKTKHSGAMSIDLNRRSFTFAGPTICYAFMQAIGMANDHTLDCFRYRRLSGKHGRG